MLCRYNIGYQINTHARAHTFAFVQWYRKKHLKEIQMFQDLEAIQFCISYVSELVNHKKVKSSKALAFVQFNSIHSLFFLLSVNHLFISKLPSLFLGSLYFLAFNNTICRYSPFYFRFVVNSQLYLKSLAPPTTGELLFNRTNKPIYVP